MRKNQILLFLFLITYTARAADGDSLSRSFRWLCDDQFRKCSIQIPDSLLMHYRNERDHLAYRYSSFNSNDSKAPANYFGFMFSQPGKKVIEDLAMQLVDDTMTMEQKINSALTFVQSLPYSKDRVSKGVMEYVRYPVETLVDGKGDCEDKAVLLGALLYELGVDFILLLPPDHMALGVACDGIEADRYFLFNGKAYYYLETTNVRWKIGQIPNEYNRAKFEVYPPDTSTTLIVRGVWFESGAALAMQQAECTLQMELINSGPGAATGLQLEVWLVKNGSQGDELLSEHTFPLEDLREGEVRKSKITFKSLISKRGILRMRITGDNIPDQALELKLK